ncbi:MAG TPA: nucleoside monophosphate kinase [bacterium]|nr:nucleoside monophosphate kinase [bacterium]
MKDFKKQPLIISVLGPPGCGKGTQAKMLINKFNLEYFGSGKSLRARQKVNDFTAKKLKIVMNKGELVPSFIISKLWIDKLEEVKKKKKFRGLLLDGSPRKRLEVKLFNGAIEWYEWDKRFKAIFIDVSKKESISRLIKRKQCSKCGRIIPWLKGFKNFEKCDKCGGKLIIRKDDNIMAIEKRWQEFNKEVMFVINLYKKENKLIKINGEQSIENVFKDIVKRLK